MSAQITVHVAGEERSVEHGTTAGDLFTGDRSVLVARVGGELRDLAHVLADGDVVEPVSAAEQDGLDVLRHSAAHVLAQAVQEVHPQARLGIGPPIRDGFYYDFDVETPFTPGDLKALEKVMQRIVNEGQTFRRREVSDEEALRELSAEPYKCELIGLKGGASQGPARTDEREALEALGEGASVEVGGAQLTIYDNVRKDGSTAWADLCRGPHVPTTKVLGNAFKLMRSAAAYWRGSEKNPQLQRVYGTAWPTKADLTAYLDRLAEAEKRDHRRLGAELDLYSFPDELGSGLPVFHPKGGVIKREMEDYARRRHIEEGFQYVGTPHITKEGLFHTSGHLPYYADTMFPPMEFEGSNYYLKAMNCPMHNLIFRSRGRSYRELPLRLFEFGSVYRYEKSGVVHGLTRVRGLEMDDSHSYVTPEQAPAEITHLLDFVLSLLRDFGLDDFYLELSTRDEGGDRMTSSSVATSSGPRRRRSSRRRQRHPGWSSSPTPAVRRSTARRSRSRPATPSGAPGRCRRSSTTSTSRRASGSSTRPPTGPVTSWLETGARHCHPSSGLPAVAHHDVQLLRRTTCSSSGSTLIGGLTRRRCSMAPRRFWTSFG